MIATRVLALAAMSTGCMVPEIDDAPDGTYACERDEECPDEHVCQSGRCWSNQSPRLEIRAPEADEVLAPPEPGSSGMRMVVVGLGGTGLELVDPGTGVPTAIGEGMVEVTIDGAVQTMVTEGDLVNGVGVPVEMADEPGAHRIAARALQGDGTPYPNPDAFAAQLVWIDDWRAHVAVVRPWPGDRFGVAEVEIDIEVASLNFTFAASEGTGEGPYGHAHVHLDDPFPACASDPECDCCYLAAAFSAGGEARRAHAVGVLPAGEVGASTLTAILRTTGHMPFVDGGGDHVFDTIAITRAEEPAE